MSDSRRQVVVYILRWFGVIPAALLTGSLSYRLGTLFIFLREPYYPAFLFPLLFLIPSGALFTVCGAMTAPQKKLLVAALLATCCMILSLLRHVLVQQNPGLTNIMHFTGESMGAAIGVLVVYYIVRKKPE